MPHNNKILIEISKSIISLISVFLMLSLSATLNMSSTKIFVEFLEKYGTDFHHIKKHPEFKEATDEDLLQMYTAHLAECASLVIGATEESSFLRIDKIFRTPFGMCAFVDAGDGQPKRKELLSLKDKRLPLLLKDREYFLKQQMSCINELYKECIDKSIVDKNFVQEEAAGKNAHMLLTNKHKKQERSFEPSIILRSLINSRY